MNQASDKNDRPLKLRDLVSLEGRVVAIHPAGVVSFQVLGASGDILDFKVRAADVEVVEPPPATFDAATFEETT